MKKYIKFKGDKINLVVLNYSENGRLAILAESQGEPYSDVTINLSDIELENNVVAINSICKSCGLEQKLIDEGIIEKIVKPIKYNYGVYDIAIINMEKLKEYDIYGLERYKQQEEKIKTYPKYNKEEMAEVGKKEGFIFVETSRGDNYIISKNDIADFIVKEAERCEHNVDMAMYVPHDRIEEPILTTCGYFLDKINPKLREEIIDRLVELQTTDTKPKDVKVFDNYIFSQMEIEEFGEKRGETIQFDKFYKQYYPESNIENKISEEEEEEF